MSRLTVLNLRDKQAEIDAFYQEIGATIRAMREAHGWSQLRLATEIGVTAVAVHHWETGRNRPNFHVLSQIERLLGPVTA